MKADSVPTNRNRSAFYAYRKRPSPSPSVCSSASSSAASTSARSVSRSQLASTSSSEQRSNKRPTSARSASYGATAPAEHAAALSIQEAHSAVASSSAALEPTSQRRRATRRIDPKFNSIANLTKTPRDFEIAVEREYADDIVKYMSAMEEPTGASVELIDQQPELAWYMRPYLIDFLVEVHSQCRLRQETLHLAVNICDRYTSKRVVYKRHYQLVGCAALWIAAKFEDAKDRIPTVQELCTITCNAYDASAFIQMEGHVLATLDWLIGHPTSEAWLRVASVSDPTMLAADSTLQHVTRFLMELTLFHRAFVPLKSSEIALGCLLLARYICGKARKLSDETPIAIQIAQMLDSHLSEHLEQVSVILTKKYASSDYANASQIVQQWYLAGRRFDIASWPSFYASTLAPVSHPLRRDSASSTSILTSSSAASSPRSYLGSSSDDEDAPVTPSTPLTPFGGSETDYGSQRAFSSPLATRAAVNAKSLVYKATGSTPENTAAALKVKLVPTSGPSMTLC